MSYLRLFRRVKIAPGVTLNLSRSGLSTSLGPRGAHYTIGPRGTRTTVGVPGTGLYATSVHTRPSQRPSSAMSAAAIIASLGLAFFRGALKSSRPRRR